MVEGLTGQDNAEEYWKLGGKLNRGGFEKARAVLSELANGKKPRVWDDSLSQAERMAQFSRVPITPEQKSLYAALRETTGGTGRESDSLPETPGTVPPWDLYDTPLLAEVFLLTGDITKRASFILAYPPNIFEKDRIVEP